MSGEILLLAHRTPFPPDRGDKIRSYNILKALAAIAPVHVGCLAETNEDLREAEELEQVAASHCMPKRSAALPIAGLKALATGVPVSLAAFADRQLKNWVKRLLAERPISAIYVFSGQMGQYVPKGWKGRLVVDFVDVDSAKFEAYARDASGPMAFVHRREERLLRAVEQQLAARADVSLLVSEEEAALMSSRCGKIGNIRSLRNGVDCGLFDPDQSTRQPELAQSEGPHFLFTGQMDYAPNVQAVSRFARVILPLILRDFPKAQFHIVGRAPSSEVVLLGELPGTRVWGAVPDMRPFLKAADMVVAPLMIARGVQNKVLEAMAMGRPVLLSPEAATGIDGKDGEHFYICRSDIEFAEKGLGLLRDPEQLAQTGSQARKLVQQQMSWPAMLAQLPQIMAMDLPGPGHRDAA